jgi:hypothetical protein
VGNTIPNPIISRPDQQRQGDPKIEEMVDEIIRKRSQLATSLKSFGQRIDTVMDWKHWIQRHPIVCLTAAASLGILLGKTHNYFNKMK